MAFFARFNLGLAFRDLTGFFRSRQRHEYGIAALAVAITGFVIFAFAHDSYAVIQPRIVYVESWPVTRTDAQIQADQKTDAAARHKAEDQRRAAFRKVADAMGISYTK